MNDTIADLLTDAADDDGRPLGFTAREVSVRGARARRRRTTIATGAVALVAGAAVTAVAVAADGGAAPDGSLPVATSSATDPSTPAPSTATPPVLTGEDALVYTRCRSVSRADLDGWTLDAQVSDDAGSTATLVSADGTRWRECTLDGRGSRGTVSPAWPLDTSPVPDPWEVPDSGIAYADQCPKESTGCSELLFTGVYPLRDGVADVEVETPQGTRVDAQTGVSTYVVRFAEARTDDPLPAVWATLRDAAGALVVRYDYNGLMR